MIATSSPSPTWPVSYTSRADRTQAVLDELCRVPQPVELSATKFAELIGCDERTVRRAVRRLELAGLVAVERRPGRPLIVMVGGDR